MKTATAPGVSCFPRALRRKNLDDVLVGDGARPGLVQSAITSALPEVAIPTATRDRRVWDRSLADRKLWLLKRSGLVGGDLKGAQIKRACIVDDLRNAYRLVHDVFLGSGYIKPEKAGMRLRTFEMSPDMATFVAKVDGKVVGVLSVIKDSPEMGLPSDGAFKDELDKLRASNQRLCEITNQAVALDYRKSSVPTELMRCAVAHLIEAGIDQAVATVSPKHSAFYDMVGFDNNGPVRNYSEKLPDPVVILAMKMKKFRRRQDDLNEAEQYIHDFLTKYNPYLTHVEKWANQARRHFINARLLKKLFVSERNFIAECSPTELEGLKTLWGHDLFNKVTSDRFIPSAEKLALSESPTHIGADADRVAEELPEKKNPEPAERNPREWEQASGSLNPSLDSWSNPARRLRAA